MSKGSQNPAYIHGRSGTPLYGVWSSIKDRCGNPSNRAYSNYGGRGVSMHPAWRDSFEAFARDLGERPSAAHTIDRFPNRDGNYEPGNIRWATMKEQSRNRRGLIEVEYQGQTVCLTEASERAGLRPGTVWERLKRGWDFSLAISTPARVGQKVRK